MDSWLGLRIRVCLEELFDGEGCNAEAGGVDGVFEGLSSRVGDGAVAASIEVILRNAPGGCRKSGESPVLMALFQCVEGERVCLGTS